MKYLMENSYSQDKKSKEDVPVSLLLLVAFLIREDVITVEQIWPYFTPSGGDDEVSKYHETATMILSKEYT